MALGPGLTLLASPEELEESCYIDTPLGVVSVLRSVLISSSRAAAYFEDGASFIHTSILAVDDEDSALLFEKGHDPALNSKVSAAPELTFVTTDHGVPVQFNCGRPLVVNHEGAEVFRVPLPERVLRLQRRGYYRLVGDPILPLKCEIRRTDDAANKVLKATVMDLSCGGFAAAVPATEPVLPDGSRHGCTLEFTGLGKIEGSVAVHGCRDAILPPDVPAKRYGLELIGLDAKKTAMIQRYIHDQERTKKKKMF